MKEIGEAFKEAREFIGISKEEAANDMDVTIGQLDNLEDGNANAFKDVFFLKELIRKYAKYLNLNEEELLQEYSEFMFSYTSRIPVNEIEKKVEEIKKEEKQVAKERVISPYTKLPKNESSTSKTIICIIIGIIIVMLVVLSVLFIKNKIDNDNFVGINIMKGEVIYESSK